MENQLQEFFNSKSDANKYLEASEQESLEIDFEKFVNKPGRPKQSETKKAFSLRLSQDVIDIIRSKPNQVAYIEELVRSNNPITLNQE